MMPSLSVSAAASFSLQPFIAPISVFDSLVSLSVSACWNEASSVARLGVALPLPIGCGDWAFADNGKAATAAAAARVKNLFMWNLLS